MDPPPPDVSAVGCVAVPPPPQAANAKSTVMAAVFDRSDLIGFSSFAIAGASMNLPTVHVGTNPGELSVMTDSRLSF
jgi:hypothetical protein